MNRPNPVVQVVGIGASAGGLDALREFFAATPADSGMAFVVIQHLDPDHVSYTAGLLARQTEMAVSEALEGVEVQANSVYTIPPNRFLFIKEGRLHLTEPIKRDGIRMPIDFFFRSLAQDQHEKAIGVLLSGSGSDGSLGIREIHATGGVVFAQDPATAQFDSMLQSAIATGLVHSVLPPAHIPSAIVNYMRQTDNEAATAPMPENADDNFQSILDLLASQNKIDLRPYRKTTVWRRIQRRMGLNRLSDISDYARFLRETPEEVTRLSKDMLIGVTSFFRDPEAFEDLRAEVIAPIVEKRNRATPLRVWTAGCSTGEEIYSIAILLREEMTLQKKTFPLQLFASDIDTKGLKCAREGIYPESIAADVSEERLARFFVKKDSSYQIDRQIRESVTFAAHNVLVDAPFIKMDLISCRNLLIYIEPETQKKVYGMFAFALNPGGYLFLGKSDGIEQTESFEAVSKNSRIYRRGEFAGVPEANFPTRVGLPPGLQSRAQRQSLFRLSDLNQDMLLKHFDAAVVLFDERGNCLHFYGPTHKYLGLPAGVAQLNLFEMIDKKHSSKLRIAVERAVRDNGTTTLEGLGFSRDDSAYVANITVSCCVGHRTGPKILAAIFQEARRGIAGSRGDIRKAGSRAADAYSARLESEIKSLRDELQATTEGYETSHEEVTAANEEFLAVNEELQSTNEELETSKEELQSVNEELITANNQLNEKIEELGHINDDLANFLNSSEIGTIFLDTHACIRRFTPAATKLLSLLPVDVGRPVGHISNKFIDVNLPAVVDKVLTNLTAIESEVQTTDGSWYLMRCLPYRTLGNKIDGVVFTFADVTGLKEAKNYAENIIRTIRESLIVLSPELKVISANRAFYETFNVSSEQTEGRLIYELGNGQWNIPRLREVLENILVKDSSFQDFEVEHDFPSIGRKIMSLKARIIENKEKNGTQLILLAIQDITQRKEAEEVQALHTAIVESSESAILSETVEGMISSWNTGAERLFGYTAREVIGKPTTMIIPPEKRLENESMLERLRRGEQAKIEETLGLSKDGRTIDISLTLSPVRDSAGRIVGASRIVRDITERKRAEQELQRLNRELERRVGDRTAELQQANTALVRDMEDRKRLENQLLQVQKLESMGTLAGGIAHDFNNIINIIQGYTGVLRKHAVKSEEIAEPVSVIQETVERASAVVQQLLTMARKTESKSERVDANTLLQSLVTLLKETLPKTIEVTLDLHRDLPSVTADRNQITQALLNLCLNARDVMPDGGKLTLKTGVVAGKSLRDYEEATADRYVCIAVTDTGPGIDESVQQRIFEPFFTTKEIGQGTGLGLAVVYGIVRRHEGFIEVNSKLTEGATFRIYLPVLSSGG
jgi:two-component system CheB/CheR fusion protein